MDPRSPGRWPDDGNDGERHEISRPSDAEFPKAPTADEFFEATGNDGGSPGWARAWPADERLAARTAAALRHDPLVFGRRLEIMVQNAVVILVGELGSAEARAAAGRRAWRVPGVADVCNRVTVAGTDPGSR